MKYCLYIYCKAINTANTAITMQTPAAAAANKQGRVNGKVSPDLKMTINKLPKISQVAGSRRQLVLSNSPPPPIFNNHNNQQQHPEYGANNQRRRFVTVVRPYSYFPEPALPPNFTPPVLNNPTNGVFVLQNNNSPAGRTRPPSPAPFANNNHATAAVNGRRQQQQHFAVAGQGVGGGGGGGGASSPSALKVNLAGGSGWDLTAIRRGYDSNPNNLNNNARNNSNGSYKAAM